MPIRPGVIAINDGILTHFSRYLLSYMLETRVVRETLVRSFVYEGCMDKCIPESHRSRTDVLLYLLLCLGVRYITY